MTEGIGNAAQTRIIAEQLFEVWKAEQEREAREGRRWWQSNAASWLGGVALLVGLIAGAVNVRSMAQDARDLSTKNEAAIAAMKADNGDRLARIETKIDLMMEERSK